MLKSLHKVAPDGVRPPRMPILRHHLLAIRELLDLDGSQRDRVLWAFWLTCWQGVCRRGDLLTKLRATKRREWDPLRDNHRGRVTITREPSDSSPTTLVLRVSNQMKPGKMNPPGETRRCIKAFIVEDLPLPAGWAQLKMLQGDHVRPGHVPRSRHW